MGTGYYRLAPEVALYPIHGGVRRHAARRFGAGASRASSRAIAPARLSRRAGSGRAGGGRRFQLGCRPARIGIFDVARAGQTDRALIHYNRALAVDSLSAAVRNDLACIYADRKQYNRALTHLDRAIALAPDLAFLHYNLASLRQYMGQFRASEDAYNRALELAPDDGKMHRGLGRLQL